MEVMESNKKQWVTPRCTVQQFEPNEYISVCGTLEDGTVLYGPSVEIAEAWNRTPAGISNYVDDDELSNPHTIYMGSFYYYDKDGQLQPDSTAYGHQEEPEDLGPLKCVQKMNKMPYGFHYHFTEVTNRS